MSTGITPAHVSQQLTAAGYPIDERRLTDWRANGWLPELARVVPPPEREPGRGAYYVWPDPEVLTQTFTLLAALGVRGRFETATVLTWFASFQYPVEQMRERWAAFEEMRWRSAIGQAMEGAPLDVGAAVDVLSGDARATRSGRKLSNDFVETLTRIQIDPHFEPTAELTCRQAEHIRDDLAQVIPDGAPVVSSMRPEQVKGLAVLLQEFLSPPKLATLIRSVSNQELAAVHKDCRFVWGPYRAWLAEAIGKASAGEEPQFLTLFPRLVWQAGRFFMILDLGLRHLGWASQIEATVAYFAELVDRPETRRFLGILGKLRKDLVAVGPTTDPAAFAKGELARQLVDSDYQRLGEIFDSASMYLADLWGPVARALLARIDGTEVPGAATVAGPPASASS